MSPISFSSLKHIAKSPAHYRHALSHPCEPNAAMRIGSAVHYNVLGGTTPYQVFRGAQRRGKEWEAFETNACGATILNAREESVALSAAAAVKDDRFAQQALKDCRFETPLGWTFCGRSCHTRGVDFHSDEIFGELKVSMTADPERFWAHATRQGWIAQLAWYEEALREQQGSAKRTPFIVAVEAKAPHIVTVFEVAEADMENGRRQVRGWMERLLQCEADDYWPGYAERVVKLEAPEWSHGLVIEGDDDEGESE